MIFLHLAPRKIYTKKNEMKVKSTQNFITQTFIFPLIYLHILASVTIFLISSYQEAVRWFLFASQPDLMCSQDPLLMRRYPFFHLHDPCAFVSSLVHVLFCRNHFFSC